MISDTAALDPRDFRNALGRFTTGVCVATTLDGTEPVGVTVSSFCSVSLDPPLILFCLGLQSACFGAFQRAEHFAINFLGESQQPLSDRFASRGDDKWAGLNFAVGANGCPMLPGTLAVLECAKEADYPAGDHVIVVGRVTRLHIGSDKAPLVHYQGRYRRLAEDNN